VLEIYNQIAAAKQARRAYQTRLKPAPADPKLLPCLCIAVSHGPAGPAKSRVMNAKTDPARTFAVASDEVLVGLIARARNRVVVIAPALTQALADALSRRFNDLGRLDITVNEHTSENGYRLECGVEGGWLRYASTTARGSIWIAGASGRGPLVGLARPFRRHRGDRSAAPFAYARPRTGAGGRSDRGEAVRGIHPGGL
jgi:hypothetical protein